MSHNQGSVSQIFFFDQKCCQAAIQFFVQDLVEKPHDFGKAGCQKFVGIIGNGDIFVSQSGIDRGGKQDNTGIFCCFYLDFKLDAAQKAGSRKEADIIGLQMIESDFFALCRENVGAEPSCFYRKKTGALLTIMERFSF